MKKFFALLVVLMMLIALGTACSADADATTDEHKETQSNWVPEENEEFYLWENQEWMKFVDEQMFEFEPDGKNFKEVWYQFKPEIDRRTMREEFWDPIEEKFFRHIGIYTRSEKNGIPGCIWPENGVISGAYAIPYKSTEGIGIIYISEKGNVLCLSADRKRNDYVFPQDIHTHMYLRDKEDILEMNYDYAVVQWNERVETWKDGLLVCWVEPPEGAIFYAVEQDGSYCFKTEDNQFLILKPEKCNNH